MKHTLEVAGADAAHNDHAGHDHGEAGAGHQHSHGIELHTYIGVSLVLGFIFMLLIDQLSGGGHMHSLANGKLFFSLSLRSKKSGSSVDLPECSRKLRVFVEHFAIIALLSPHFENDSFSTWGVLSLAKCAVMTNQTFLVTNDFGIRPGGGGCGRSTHICCLEIICQCSRM